METYFGKMPKANHLKKKQNQILSPICFPGHRMKTCRPPVSIFSTHSHLRVRKRLKFDLQKKDRGMPLFPGEGIRKECAFFFILSFRNLNSSCKRGKEGHSQAAGTSKVQTQSLVLCQLENIHDGKQLHKPPHTLAPVTLLHRKNCSSECAL